MSLKKFLLRITPRFLKDAIKSLIKIIIKEESKPQSNQQEQQKNNLLQIKRQNFQLTKLAVTDKLINIKHFPLTAYLETSLKCNLNCIMCPGHSFKETPSPASKDHGILSLKTFRKLKPFLPYLDRCVLSGDGEPLLNPGLMEIIKEIKAYNIWTGFITNGILLNKSVSDKL